jgi:hypothetical protein
VPPAVVKRSITVAGHKASVAEYIADMSRELAELASESKLHVLQHLLNMVANEARQRAVRDASAHNRPSRLKRHDGCALRSLAGASPVTADHQ